MLSHGHLTVYRRGGFGPGRHVVSVRPAPNGEIPMTPYEARRLAAELTAAADAIEPPPTVRSKTPLGWTYRHVLVVDLDEAAVVDTIAEMYLAGRTHAEMIAILNSRGLRTKTGRPWKSDNLARELTRLHRAGIVNPVERQQHRDRLQLALPDAG